MTSDDTTQNHDASPEQRRSIDVTVPSAIGSGFDRRSFLRATSAATVAGLLGGTTSNAVAQSTPNWEAEADERIEQHRKGGLEVNVQDANGNAVSNATVNVAMQDHDFHFGTAVNANMYEHGIDKDGNEVSPQVLQKYRDVTNNMFNTAVLENAHKWKFWEDDPQLAHDATDRLLENDFDVRGHVCIWGRTEVGAIPDDVLQAVENRNAEKIKRRSKQHIEDIISYYGDDIMEWEVVNESMNTWHLQKGIYGDRITDGENQDVWTGDVVPWKSPIMAEWYQTAADAAPEGVGLGINDFNVLTPEYDYAKTWFNNWANHIIDSGVDLDFMGMQSHMKVANNDNLSDGVEDRRLEPDQLMTDLDHFAQPTGSLRITEFDFAQSDQSLLTQQEAADYFYKFLKTTFSHPAVEQFLMWGFWDKLHWSSPWSPMFDENFEKKPGYDVWDNLVLGEWWTDISDASTNSSGRFSTDVFLGTHVVEVETDAGTATKTVEVTDSDGTESVTLTVRNDDTAPVEPIDGTMPTDPDGDDVYEDLNGNERIDYNDVVTYYNNREDPVMTDHVDSYDFNDNDRLDYNDVVELYQERTD